MKIEFKSFLNKINPQRKYAVTCNCDQVDQYSKKRAGRKGTLIKSTAWSLWFSHH